MKLSQYQCLTLYEKRLICACLSTYRGIHFAHPGSLCFVNIDDVYAALSYYGDRDEKRKLMFKLLENR